MSVKVINPGKLPDAIFGGVCMNCRCVVECDRNDVTTSPDQREPGQYLHCPTPGCNRLIWLEPKGQ